jgi:hypothetical protein
MVPTSVRQLDVDRSREELAAGVQLLSVADIESMSIEDISSLQHNVLKDLLNDAIRHRLQQHLGGTYTSAPAISVAESAQSATA